MGFTATDHRCMALALRLARNGQYSCDPNPRVGCVFAVGDRVIGRGWHHKAGDAHAEINALADAGPLPGETTAYVTLEPCSHHGRTPPCAEALAQSGVSRVVVAMEDPNPMVSGAGLDRLRSAGVKVETGLMSSQARRLNRGFICRQETGRPWVRVKIATSLDGRTALASGESQWISGEASRADVQRWRARSSALLTGSGTVLADDPRLSARVDFEALQPTRVVLDSHWRTPASARLLQGDTPVIVFGSSERPLPDALGHSRAECIPVGSSAEGIDLDAVLSELAAREVNELQVEAGPRLCGSLLKAGLVDEILLYQAPQLLGDGALPPFSIGPLESMSARTHLRVQDRRVIGADTRFILSPVYE